MYRGPLVNTEALPAIEAFFNAVEETTERLGLAMAYETALADSQALLFPVQPLESQALASIETFNEFLRKLGGLPIKYRDEIHGGEVRTYLIGCFGINHSEGTWLMVAGESGEVPTMDGATSMVTLRPNEFRSSFQRAITEPT